MTASQQQIEAFVLDHFRAKSEGDHAALLIQFAPDVKVWTPLSLTSRGFVERPTVGAAADGRHHRVGVLLSEGRASLDGGGLGLRTARSSRSGRR